MKRIAEIFRGKRLGKIKIEVKRVSVDGSWKPVLEDLAKYALQRGYVKDSFIPALIKRETEYPTGLEIPNGVNVAIPHAEVEHVLEQALLIGVPSKPVKFHSMEDPNKLIDVNLILLLIISNPDGYVKFLSKLTLLFQDKDFISYTKSGRYEDLGRLIAERCL